MALLLLALLPWLVTPLRAARKLRRNMNLMDEISDLREGHHAAWLGEVHQRK